MGISRATGRTTMNEINVTPMVDVMLVLLIIFMVTTPLIQQGVEVKLPDAAAAPVEGDAEKLVISVDANRKIFIGTAPVEFDELETKLKLNEKAQRDKEVYLQADAAIPYGSVMAVMAAAQRAGIKNVGMLTDPASTTGKTP